MRVLDIYITQEEQSVERFDEELQLFIYQNPLPQI